tara:strand:- start:3572 stop:4678 length:1107 start_codon:yes stop_codon:yes gene_type:complete
MVSMLHGAARQRARRESGVVKYEVQNAEIVTQAVKAGHGVLITPNHPTHADAYAMSEAARAAKTSFYFMAAWNLFERSSPLARWILQKSGVFSVDREGTDLAAIKIARDIIREKKHPLVIFPEGEVYHCNQRVTPFREGAAAIALFAARKANRKTVCIPCALKYTYLDDPMPKLEALMTELERAIHWRPRTESALVDRIYPVGAALLSLKELEYLGEVSNGPLPERTRSLAGSILSDQEERYGLSAGDSTIPERVKALRRAAIVNLEKNGPSAVIDRDLDDLFVAVQLFSYPGNYVVENPTIDRIAETLDKFEEDVLMRYSPTPRGKRKVTVRFGKPIEAPAERRKSSPEQLTDELEQAVQAMLDDME